MKTLLTIHEQDIVPEAPNNIDDATTLLEQDEPTNYAGKFIWRRDLALLKVAKSLVL